MISACFQSKTVKFCERQFLYKAVQFMWENSEKRKPEKLWWTYLGSMSAKVIFSIFCASFDLLATLWTIVSGILLTDALYVTSVGHVTVSISSTQLSVACDTALQSTIRDHRLNVERENTERHMTIFLQFHYLLSLIVPMSTCWLSFCCKVLPFL